MMEKRMLKKVSTVTAAGMMMTAMLGMQVSAAESSSAEAAVKKNPIGFFLTAASALELSAADTCIPSIAVIIIPAAVTVDTFFNILFSIISFPFFFHVLQSCY